MTFLSWEASCLTVGWSQGCHPACGGEALGRAFPVVPGTGRAWAGHMACTGFSSPPEVTFPLTPSQPSLTHAALLKESPGDTLVSALGALFWYISLDLFCLISEVRILSPSSESEVEIDVCLCVCVCVCTHS